MFPETSKKFFSCIPYWIKFSTCDALCQWRKSLHCSFKEYRIFFLTLGLLWSLSWMQCCCNASYSAFNFSFIISEGSKLKSGRPKRTWSWKWRHKVTEKGSASIFQREVRKFAGPWFNVGGNLVVDNIEKAEIFFVFFSCSETRDSTMAEAQVQDCLEKMDVFSFLGLYAKIDKSSFK